MSHFRDPDLLELSPGFIGVHEGEVAFLVIKDGDQMECVSLPSYDTFLGICHKYNFDPVETLRTIETAPEEVYGFVFDTSLYGKDN